MFKKTVFTLPAVLLLFSVPSIAAHVHTLTASNSVMSSHDLPNARLVECQPLRGDTVEKLEEVKNAGGVLGATLVRVKVITGSCAGTEGWVGLTHLASSSQ